MSPSPRSLLRHRAWVVAAVTRGALVAAAAFRSSTGVLIEPIEREFGWSREVTLAVYYALRGASLLTAQSLLGPTVEPTLFVFIIFYGLDWVATVPPTVALCRQWFGLSASAIVFDWVFAARMVGAAAGAGFAGWQRATHGS